MTAYRHNDWKLLIGASVEVRKDHEFFRYGVVDEAMPDSALYGWPPPEDTPGS